MEDAGAVEPRSRGDAARAQAKSRRILTPKLILSAVAAALLLAAGLYAFHLLEQFLISDPRFALGSADNDASPLSTAGLTVSGATHASERSIEAVFSEDQGRSVYLMPLGERRMSLRAVDWVKDATVARVWPNRVQVRVQERTPVAFIALRGSRFGLIDEDGVILSPSKDRYHLPVLTGVHAADQIAERKERVRRMLRLTAELGEDAQKLSEIDVNDRDNL